jgi:peptide/nickel transport system substrate-binding protein
MQAVVGDNPDIWRESASFFTPGTDVYTEEGGEILKGKRDVDGAKKLLAEAGLLGAKVTLVVAMDVAITKAEGEVTADLLKKIGFDVDFVATDWGTVAQRRNNRDTVEKGGWSVHHTWGPSTIRQTPVEHSQIRGQGAKGWFGWYEDAEVEKLTRAFVEAPSQAERDAIADTIQKRAFETVPSVPLGTFQIPTAYRRNLTGLIEATGPYMWNIRRA